MAMLTLSINGHHRPKTPEKACQCSTFNPIDQQQRCRPNTLQLVDAVAGVQLIRLRRALPGIALVQVIHVKGPDSIDEACAVAEVQPFGLDVCSGVRTDGVLDESKLRAFLSAAQQFRHV